MDSWNEMWNAARGERCEGGGINSPVTIVEGARGPAPCGPTIDLQQYTDYVLRKFLQQQSEWEGAGLIPSNGSMVLSKVGQTADQPLIAIGNSTRDSMFLMDAGLVCTVSDGTAGTLTMTITYFDVTAGSQTVSFTLPLTSTGNNSSGPALVFVLGGSTVVVSIVNSGVYGVAKYDAFVSFTKLA